MCGYYKRLLMGKRVYRMRQVFALFVLAVIMLLPVQLANAVKPKISFVYPGYQGRHLRVWNLPHMIMGEGLDDPELEVWVWSPRKADEAAQNEPVFSRDAYDFMPQLPDEPPDDAKRMGITSRENHVVMATLRANTVVWLRNSDGFSKPYMLNVARPFWLSRETAHPGEKLHIFGYGVRPRYGDVRIGLRRDGETVAELEPGHSPRGLRDKDSRLIYFRLPDDLQAGDYDVYTHNGYGAAFGWRHVASLKITPAPENQPTIIDVTDHGATGDDAHNDIAAIETACAAAAEAGGGTVYFPQGTYRVNRTLNIPEGVTLRGANRDGAVIEGFGYHPDKTDRQAWYSSDPIPASVLMLTTNTGLESLTVTGYVAEGNGGHALVSANPDENRQVNNVTVRDCRLLSTATHPKYDTAMYAQGRALRIWAESHHVRIVDNKLDGGLKFSRAYRMEIRDNEIKNGGVRANAFESVLGGNFFTNAPFRILFYPKRHSYIRYNEMHDYFRDSWNNAPEPYLTHGGGNPTISNPTKASGNTLTDTTQNWEAGDLKNRLVLISAGRGFGQYRWVVDNTEDTLTLNRPWRVAPDADSEYTMGTFHVESAYYANMIDSPGVLSLWLDCVNMAVERYRAESAGVTIWGNDRARKKEDKIVDGRKYYPSWYNMISNNWMDGSRIHMTAREHESSPNRGPALFGTYVVDNRIVEPQHERIPHEHIMPRSKGGVVVGGNARYSVVAENFISFSNIGISVPKAARKTFLIENEFQQIDRPIVDRGLRTRQQGNKVFEYDAQKGEHHEKLPDSDSTEDVDYRRPRPPRNRPADDDAVSAADQRSIYKRRARWVRGFVSYIAYERQDIQSKEATEKCQKNLQRLYRIIRDYEADHGKLPDAAFYPPYPHTQRPGLTELLDDQASRYMRCPAAGPDMKKLGWPSYIWNETLSGKPLSEIENRDTTWLLMDVWAPHGWMMKNEMLGHHGGANVLFADGSVKWMEGFDWQAWGAHGHKITSQ